MYIHTPYTKYLNLSLAEIMVHTRAWHIMHQAASSCAATTGQGSLWTESTMSRMTVAYLLANY